MQLRHTHTLVYTSRVSHSDCEVLVFFYHSFRSYEILGLLLCLYSVFLAFLEK